MGLFDNWGSPTRIFDPLNITGLDKTPEEANRRLADSYRTARPNDPTWNNIWDMNTMSMTPDMEKRLNDVNLDKTGLNAFQAEALRNGPSEWANRATRQQESLGNNALDMGSRQVAGQGATARSQLAMRGGLSSGARERLATEGQRNYLDMAQGVNQQKSANEMQIGMNDEQNRMQQLGMLPGMQVQATGVDLDKLKLYGQSKQFDVTNDMTNRQNQNAFNMDRYKAQMAEYGAGQTAAATQNAGKHKK